MTALAALIVTLAVCLVVSVLADGVNWIKQNRGRG